MYGARYMRAITMGDDDALPCFQEDVLVMVGVAALPNTLLGGECCHHCYKQSNTNYLLARQQEELSEVLSKVETSPFGDVSFSTISFCRARPRSGRIRATPADSIS